MSIFWPRSFVCVLGMVTSGCVSGGSSISAPEALPDDGGYFVALAAEGGSAESLALYDGLLDAIDAYNRKQADRDGRLPAYVEAFDADGYTRLADGKSEIECDRTKCLVKLASRSLGGSSAQPDALAVSLTRALSDKGAIPERFGSGESQTRTYLLGQKTGLHVSCIQKGIDPRATYRCDFELASGATAPKAAQALEPAARGRLVGCALSPGTVRSAKEAKAELEGGDLAELLAVSAAGGKAVGYLRFVRQGRDVEFVDLFLCGDLSHDHFVIEGAAKSPRVWLPTPLKIGTGVAGIETIHEDDVRLAASSSLLEETQDSYVVEVAFRFVRESDASTEVYGEDRFVLRLRKAWISK